ncbi:hypothetical protein EDD15DRAFT_2196254 [Pisolithus albus]|nr:hypothetical protein EDD15DRAFT_2196253 [Pisolithus albus]KAI5994194.1 hypothetical protein EDD15DRAFT_2196254 [Pisolithus albus]
MPDKSMGGEVAVSISRVMSAPCTIPDPLPLSPDNTTTHGEIILLCQQIGEAFKILNNNQSAMQDQLQNVLRHLKAHKGHLDNHEGQLCTVLGEVENHEHYLQQVYGRVKRLGTDQALLPMKLYNSCIPPTGMLKGPWGFIPAVYPNMQEKLCSCSLDACILLSQFLQLELPNSSSLEEH